MLCRALIGWARARGGFLGRGWSGQTRGPRCAAEARKPGHTWAVLEALQVPSRDTEWYSRTADHPLSLHPPSLIRTHSLRAAVMPQDRRSPPQTTQHTAQAPIVQTDSAAAAASAPNRPISGGVESANGERQGAGRERASAWGRCGWPYRRSPLCAGRGAVECICPRRRGNPAHVRPSSRPERQNQDAAGRSSPPRSGIHTAVEPRAVDPRPYY